MGFRSEDYGLYFEHDFRHRWLRPDTLVQKLHKYMDESSLDFSVIGKSVEGRDIHLIRWGKGPRKILLWSQMHGNEPTATMAIIDLLNFFTKDDQYNELRESLSEKLSIFMIPMLNPDGAERFTRQNALGVDLNRDALTGRMPEMQAFWKLVEDLKPDWAFNLHDQRNIFSAGDTAYPATISFLSASAEITKKMTPAREKSMKLIGLLADLVEDHLPRHVGRYSDEFYPRALGDNFHHRDIPCVLIESGAYPDDEFRDQARKLNFLCMLRSFKLIASEGYDKESTDRYHDIPENRTNFYDLILRDCRLEYVGKEYTADIGLLFREEINEASKQLERKYLLKELGDLQFNHGLREEQGGLVKIAEDALKFEQPANFRVLRDKLPNLNFKNGILYEEH